MNSYKFNRGLGKTQIGLAIHGCSNCKKSRTMLFSVVDKSGNKAYSCKDCLWMFRERKKE